MKTLLLTLTVILVTALSPAYAMQQSGGGVVYADVNGLVCDFCARALEKVFGKQEEVSDINVNLDTKVVTIAFKDGQSLDDETIRRLITDSGYNVVDIRHEALSADTAEDQSPDAAQPREGAQDE